MNQTEQMREALQECQELLEALPAIVPTNIELVVQAIETREKVEQALAAEPAPLVRLTDLEIAHVLGDEIDNVYLQDFHKVMDAMIAKNWGKV